MTIHEELTLARKQAHAAMVAAAGAAIAAVIAVGMGGAALWLWIQQ